VTIGLSDGAIVHPGHTVTSEWKTHVGHAPLKPLISGGLSVEPGAALFIPFVFQRRGAHFHNTPKLGHGYRPGHPRRAAEKQKDYLKKRAFLYTGHPLSGV
jgi:hypothetical protein